MIGRGSAAPRKGRMPMRLPVSCSIARLASEKMPRIELRSIASAITAVGGRSKVDLS